jgi:hypothetical protein
MPPGAASAIGTAPQVPPRGAPLHCCPVLPGRNAFVGSHDLPEAVGTNHPPPTLPTASLLLISLAAGEDREGTGGESATGKMPSPDGSTQSPTRTPLSAVSGTPSHGSKRPSTATPSPVVTADGGRSHRHWQMRQSCRRNCQFWLTGAVACNA